MGREAVDEGDVVFVDSGQVPLDLAGDPELAEPTVRRILRRSRICRKTKKLETYTGACASLALCVLFFLSGAFCRIPPCRELVRI